MHHVQLFDMECNSLKGDSLTSRCASSSSSEYGDKFRLFRSKGVRMALNLSLNSVKGSPSSMSTLTSQPGSSKSRNHFSAYSRAPPELSDFTHLEQEPRMAMKFGDNTRGVSLSKNVKSSMPGTETTQASPRLLTAQTTKYRTGSVLNPHAATVGHAQPPRRAPSRRPLGASYTAAPRPAASLLGQRGSRARPCLGRVGPGLR